MSSAWQSDEDWEGIQWDSAAAIDELWSAIAGCIALWMCTERRQTPAGATTSCDACAARADNLRDRLRPMLGAASTAAYQAGRDFEPPSMLMARVHLAIGLVIMQILQDEQTVEQLLRDISLDQEPDGGPQAA